MNYVIFGYNEDFVKSIFGELKKNNIVAIRDAFVNEKILKLLFRFHFSDRVNSIFQLPGKSIWKYQIYKENLETQKNDLTIYISFNHSMTDTGFIPYSHRKQNCKHVLLYADLISKNNEKQIEMLKKQFDLVMTYDKGEAEKYGVTYWPAMYSKIAVPVITDKFEYDVLFVGYAKNRLNEIVDAYDFFVSKGLRCMFSIVGVAKKEQSRFCGKPGVILNKYIPYEDYLKYVEKSRCILEVTQKNSTGITMRTTESIFYKRKLITNNSYLKDTEFYNPSHMFIYEIASEIDKSFIEEPIPFEKIDSGDNLHISNLLPFLENYFKNEEK